MLTQVYIIPFIMTVLIGLLGFISNRKHLLSTLLSLEMVVLGLFGAVVYVSFMYWGDLYISMIFLTFSVCEGALGLGVLVFLVRSHGNDYFQTFNLLKC
uniref:NADH-ubiquinone oxidoreductase chain 4L n=1 Tax=Caenis sp. JYZ-2018 TaxID=2493714 RepID=A0A3S8Q075_9INSE|nr:NADH dehydrogenase subunit 4L [Caenis sp. JYZ-2018]